MMRLIELYRIRTMNSEYEIKVVEAEGKIRSACKKLGPGGRYREVKVEGTEYLEKLFIGPSFDVPGVVLTSCVTDYDHFVLSTEEKRSIPADQHLLTPVVDHVLKQVHGH